MTALPWLNAINGSFASPFDWSGGDVPGASDDTILDAVGSSFTVTSVTDETVQSGQLASTATRSPLAGTFDASAGAGSSASAGIILVGGGATLVVDGTVTNTGTIILDRSSKASHATMVVDDSVTVLTGSGMRPERQRAHRVGPRLHRRHGRPWGAGWPGHSARHTGVGSRLYTDRAEDRDRQEGLDDARRTRSRAER